MRATRSVLFWLALATLWSASGLAAFGGAVPVPFERAPLGANEVVLDLHHANVEVAVDDVDEPRLEVSLMAEVDDVSVMMVYERRGQLEVVQPHGADGASVPVRIRLVVRPDHRVTVRGRGLDVSLVDRREELSEQERKTLDRDVGLSRGEVARPGGSASRYMLELDDSLIELRRLTGGNLSGRGNDVVLTHCRGPFVVDLADSRVEAKKPWGTLYLEARRSEFQLSDVRARVETNLRDSGLTISGGMGPLKGRVEGGSLSLGDWAGPVTLDGSEIQLSAQDLSSPQDFLTLRGSDHEVVATDVAGALRVQVAASQVEVSSLGGRALVSAEEGSDVRLADVAGSVELKLRDGSVAALDRISGRVEGRVRESELTASDLMDGIDVSGGDSLVALSGVQGGLRAKFANSIVDLQTLSRNPADLEFRGRTEARVGLPTPCRVRLAGAVAARGRDLPAGVSLGPCDLFERGSGRRLQGGARPVNVQLSIAGESEVEFWER